MAGVFLVSGKLSLFTDPLFSLQSPSSARNRGRFIDRLRKGVGMGEKRKIEENSSLFFFLALRARSRALASLADVFEKNEKKNKTTSIYRLR